MLERPKDTQHATQQPCVKIQFVPCREHNVLPFERFIDYATSDNIGYSYWKSYFFFFFFHCHYSPLWHLACRTMSFNFFLSATNSLHLLTPSTLGSLSTSSYHVFLGLPLLLVPSSSWLKIFLVILSSSIISRWPNQLILYPFIHFTISSPLLISSREDSQHFKISFYFLFPSFPESSPSSRPFQLLSEDLFGHPILLHYL